MINIFNLFLILFSFWLLFSYSNGSLSWFYVCFGLLSSLLVSFVSWKMKIITKHSNFLFLHIGFYRHFLGIIFSSFPASLLTIFRAAIASPKVDYKIYFLPIKKLNNPKFHHTSALQASENQRFWECQDPTKDGNWHNIELALLIPTINLLPNIVFVGLEDQNMIICGLGEQNIAQLDLEKIYVNLAKINDNNLV